MNNNVSGLVCGMRDGMDELHSTKKDEIKE